MEQTGMDIVAGLCFPMKYWKLARKVYVILELYYFNL
jgi:hypothetical protein